MKKLKTLVATLLSVTVIFGMAAPVYAAGPTSEVQIAIQPTDMNVSVTVPSTLPIVFNADGTNTIPSNWTIQNVSAIAGIHLVKVNLTADGTGWKLTKDSERVKTQDVNGKAIRFSVGLQGNRKVVDPNGGSESESGSATFEYPEIAIASGEEKVLSYEVERGAFTETKASAKAFTMVLEFAFN